MPNVRFVHYPPRIVEAKLMSWEPGIPGIWFRYHDGIETMANATYDTQEIQAQDTQRRGSEQTHKGSRDLSHRSGSSFLIRGETMRRILFAITVATLLWAYLVFVKSWALRSVY